MDQSVPSPAAEAQPSTAPSTAPSTEPSTGPSTGRPAPSRLRPASLTSRLVLIAVSLVVAISVLLGAATLAAVSALLGERLDDDVRAALTRAVGDPRLVADTSSGVPDPGWMDHGPGPRGDGAGPGRGEGPGGPGHHGPPEPGDVRGQGIGTLTAVFTGEAPVLGVGNVLAQRSRATADRVALGTEALGALVDVPADGSLHRVLVPGLGPFRVTAQLVDPDTAGSASTTQKVVVGLPTAALDEVLHRLLLGGLVVILLGALAAAALGRVLVRRELRPLREVAATAHEVSTLPLATGEVDLGHRVPDSLTGGSTEVDQVAASVNAMLDHVEAALAARHRSEEQVRQFVADASHELRTPLATIKGYAELARRRPDDVDGLRLALGKVEAESTRMTGLVEDLLLLARLDSGRPLQQAPVDLTRLLLEAVSDARVVAPGHHWRLDLPDQVVETTGDEQRLHQVITNLLANAAKYTPEGSTVTVSARPGRIDVHDDGPGFAPEMVDTAFDRFVRGEHSRTRDHSAPGGHGLGLSLVQAILAAHGGRVDLRSAPGDTTISLHLPQAPTNRSGQPA